MSSPRNPGFEEAVEIMARESARHGVDWEHAETGVYPCLCGEGASDTPGWFENHVQSHVLDALLAATRDGPCPTCGGAETVRCVDPGCEPEDGDRHEHFVECPDCTDGRVSGTVPLVILAPVLAHPTVKIPDDVPGWEGVTLPAAYHDPLRDGSPSE